VAGLALGDRQAFALPVDVVKGERGDLPATQPVGDQQQQDGVVAPARFAPALDTGQDPVDIVPGDRPRDARKPVNLGAPDGGTQVGGDDAFPPGVPQEHPQDTDTAAHRALGQARSSALDDEGGQDRR
jgi:hypothetical protein